MAASQQNAEGAPMLPQLKHTLANLAHRVHAGAAAAGDAPSALRRARRWTAAATSECAVVSLILVSVTFEDIRGQLLHSPGDTLHTIASSTRRRALWNVMHELGTENNHRTMARSCSVAFNKHNSVHSEDMLYQKAVDSSQCSNTYSRYPDPLETTN